MICDYLACIHVAVDGALLAGVYFRAGTGAGCNAARWRFFTTRLPRLTDRILTAGIVRDRGLPTRAASVILACLMKPAIRPGRPSHVRRELKSRSIFDVRIDCEIRFDDRWGRRSKRLAVNAIRNCAPRRSDTRRRAVSPVSSRPLIKRASTRVENRMRRPRAPRDRPSVSTGIATIERLFAPPAGVSFPAPDKRAPARSQ